MKISFFSFPNLAYGGGFERYIMDLAVELAKKGHTVSIVTINRDLQYRLESLLSIFYMKRKVSLDAKFKFSESDLKKYLENVSLYEVSSLKEMRERLKQSDIIYSKNEIVDLFVLRLLNLGRSPPIICGVHTAIFYPHTENIQSKIHNFLYLGIFYGKLLQECSAFHVLNSEDVNVLHNNFPSVRAPIKQIPHYVDVDNYALNDSNEDFNILFVGRLDTEQKGVDVLVRIVEYLSSREDFDCLKFTVVGSGELSPIMEKLAGKYSNFSYKGYVEQETLQDLYASSDLCIVPSRWETFSYVCLESQSHGLPVIASDIPGPRDIIIENETGFLVNPDRPAEFGNRVLFLYQMKKTNPVKYADMRKKIQKCAIERFSKKRILCRLEDMFKNSTTQK